MYASTHDQKPSKFPTLRLNNFHLKLVASATVSPRIIMTQNIIKYKIYCRISFGLYVQTHENNQTIHDTEEPCILSPVSFGPTGNRQGRYHFLKLTTGKHITRNHFTTYPMNNIVLCRIERIGIRHGIKPKLDFFGCNRNLIHNMNEQDSIDQESREKMISDSENSADSAYSDRGTDSKDEKFERTTEINSNNELPQLLTR